MPDFAPEIVHDRLLDAAPRSLAFDRQGITSRRQFAAWKRKVGAKFRDVLGQMPDPVPVDVRIESDTAGPEYRERRLLFAAEEGADVPCHLLTPIAARGRFPVVICLQGHTTGAHISLGRAKYPNDEKSLGGDRDFAIQAVRQGFAALSIEQRCFGERSDCRPAAIRGSDRCHHASMAAILLGRTMIGERAWDVSRAIDAIAAFPDLDASRIGCMGNSGGGTTTYYAACIDPRITVAMPSCYVCTFRDSIGRINHCADNYLPGALRWFEMGDLAALIAPRPLIVVAGREDGIFPIAGVRETFATIGAIYAAAGAPENCALVVGEGGHRFYAADAWPVFRRLSGW